MKYDVDYEHELKDSAFLNVLKVGVYLAMEVFYSGKEAIKKYNSRIEDYLTEKHKEKLIKKRQREYLIERLS